MQLVVTDVYCCRLGPGVDTYDAGQHDQWQAALDLVWAHACRSRSARDGPVLIKHAVSQWPALKQWSLDWLARNYPEHRSCALSG